MYVVRLPPLTTRTGLMKLWWPCAGGRILLKNANLHLFRGRRYGLCGANGVGKVLPGPMHFPYIRSPPSSRPFTPAKKHARLLATSLIKSASSSGEWDSKCHIAAPVNSEGLPDQAGCWRPACTHECTLSMLMRAISRGK
jgi:hypothetical protein